MPIQEHLVSAFHASSPVHKTYNTSGYQVVTAALDRFEKRPAPGFSDCPVLEKTRKAGHTLPGTFDRNLSMLDGAKRLE
ncbi:MAG TPA: hypothetical protein VNO35_19205 [Steroidobacteraceae bacterium]|nr:hypothetical protein [Steroidobacteraceae bacterium]